MANATTKVGDEDAEGRAARVLTLPITRYVRRVMAVGPSLLLVGLGMVGTGASDAGRVVTLVGLALTIWGVHSYGRLGPDAFSLAATERAPGKASGELRGKERESARRAAGMAVADGVIIALVGVGVTVGTYMFANPGGSFVVAYGATAVGVARALRAYMHYYALRD